MTVNQDAQKLIDEALAAGHQTTVGYVNKHWKTPPAGTQWATHEAKLKQARAILDVAVPPPVDPPTTPRFGANLDRDYPRLARSTGQTVKVATKSELEAAITSAPLNATILATQTIDGGGTQLNIDRQAAAAAPLTLDMAPGVKLTGYDQFYLGKAAYWRFRGEYAGWRLSSVKPTVDAHDIELEKAFVHDGKGQGFLMTDAAYNVQVWDSTFQKNGSNGNKDHGIYWGYARGKCVLANSRMVDNWAFGLQIYPKAQGLVVTCCEVKGGIQQPDARGGIVIGSEISYGASAWVRDTLGVGLIVRDAPSAAALYVYAAIGPNNRFYDSLSWNNAGGDWHGISSYNVDANRNQIPSDYVKFERCINGDPALLAKGYIDRARYGWVPALDMNGKPRVTADAGAVAL